MTLHDVRPFGETAPPSRTPAIRFRNVSKTYKLYERHQDRMLDQIGLTRLMVWRKAAPYQSFHALNDVDLTIGHGERVGIIGRNGAGKTTLLKLITDNFLPTTGQVEVNGTVQALMQLGLGFHPEFSCLDNIRAALTYNGLSGQALAEAMADVIEFVELGDFLSQPMKTYSLGMNARVQFAAATAIRPDIVLIDEILGAGDSYFAAKSALRMQRLAKSGCTILLVSHSWQQIQQYCERVIWLRDGRVYRDGVPHEVLAAYEVHIADETAKARIPIPPKGKAPGVPGSGAKETDGADMTSQDGAAATAPVAPQRTAPEPDGVVPAVPAPSGVLDEAPPPVLEGTDYATVHWIAERIREHEGIAPSDEFQDRLDNGQRVFRIAGIPGLRFSHVAVTSGARPVQQVRTGEPLEIRFRVRADRTDAFECTYWIHFFGLDGRRLCRVESPPDRFSLREGEAHEVTIDLAPLLLGAGDYLLSFSLFDLSQSGSAADTLNTRFEMLARSYQLKVAAANDSDPPLIHYPGRWTFGSSPTLHPSLIRGGV